MIKLFGKKKKIENVNIQNVDMATEKPTETKKKGRVKKIIFRTVKIILLVALLAGVALFVRYKLKRENTSDEVQTTSIVTMGGFQTTVSGTGTVTPIDSYTISPLITGKILECPFNEGDAINEGDLLYRFEDSEAQAKIKSAQSALNSAQRSLDGADKTIERAKKGITEAEEKIEDIKERMEKLTVRAPSSGMVENLTAKVGDDVSGTLCSVLDYSDISVTVSFNKPQFDSIKVGDSVTIGISKLSTTVPGTVERKYTAPHAMESGATMYSVKIKVNTRSLAEGFNVSVTVHTASGDVQSPTAGTTVYAEPETVTLDESGELVKLNFSDGDQVEKGDVIAVLKSDTLDDELDDAKDALEDAKESYQDALDQKESLKESVETAQAELDNVVTEAEDYTITSPISGVVLEKYYKAGDTFGNDDDKKTLMVIADMSSMTFELNIDELDISNVWEGQDVNIICDALPGESIMGKVTSVSKIGSGENGVTGYPAVITIDEPGNLMSGMNVTAEIMVGSVENVLVAPSSAIFLVDGLYYVTVVTTDESGAETETQVEVGVGLHNKEYYEITSGLNEGDVLRDTGLVSSDDEMYYYG